MRVVAEGAQLLLLVEERDVCYDATPAIAILAQRDLGEPAALVPARRRGVARRRMRRSGVRRFGPRALARRSDALDAGLSPRALPLEVEWAAVGVAVGLEDGVQRRACAQTIGDSIAVRTLLLARQSGAAVRAVPCVPMYSDCRARKPSRCN